MTAEPAYTFVPFQFDIDIELFEWWVEGLDTDEAVQRRLLNETSQNSSVRTEMPPSVIEEAVVGEAADYYHLFALIEPHFHQPLSFLRSSPLFGSLTEPMKLALIERYYSLDPAVVREFYGRKPFARDKKELDDISERTTVPLRSCRRQYDNIRRAWKLVEDSSGNSGAVTPGTGPANGPVTSSTPVCGRSSNSDACFPQTTVSLLGNIFCLPLHLAWQYTCVLFLCRHRFDATKRRGLLSLNGQSFFAFARCLIDQWSYLSVFSPSTSGTYPNGMSSSQDSGTNARSSEEFDIDFDKDFFQELKELRTLLERENLDLATRSWNSRGSSNRMSLQSQGHYDWLRDTIRGLVGIAVKLNRGKETRGLFVDLMEDVVEPSVEAGWALKDFESLMGELRAVDLKFQQNLSQPWLRFMQGVSPILLEMFRSRLAANTLQHGSSVSGSQSVNHSLTSASPVQPNFLTNITTVGLSASHVAQD